jgi:sterol 3beta-glucosyltransferase
MRAILTNFGSTGSVYPFISLAIELKRNGHEAIVALSPYFSDWVKRFELDFAPIGPDLKKIQYDINEAMQDMPESEDWIRDLFAPLFPALPQMFEELREACRNADVLISGPWQPASMMIHELTGIPFVTVQNAHFGGGGTPAFQRASASLINPFRNHHGLPMVANPLTADANSPQLVLYNMSRHVRSPLPDWPPHYHMPGYFFLDDETWRPDAALEAFINEGPAVVISFGSMTHEDPDALTRLMIKAIDMVGCRAIIQQGWSGLAQTELRSNIHVTGFTPHDWLFPRASCVVHHGGSGTSASVFRSGKPSVFVPHTYDQPMWAELAEGLGCAGPTIPYLELSADRLADSLIKILRSPRYFAAAADLGEKLRAEHGLRRARQLVEELVERMGVRHQETESNRAIDEGKYPEDKLNRRKRFLEKQRGRKREANL